MRCFPLMLSALLLGVAAGQTCTNGVPGISDGPICCNPGCVQCGGDGCSDSSPGLKGEDCCISDITRSGILCKDSGTGPCIDTTSGDSPDEESPDEPQEPPTEFECTGDAGIRAGAVCCEASCGECGGDDCHLRGGGGLSCCWNAITRADESCSEKGEAPCVFP